GGGVMRDGMSLAREHLRSECSGHVKAMIEFFAAQNPYRLEAATRRWEGLLAGSLWDRTQQLAFDLYSVAVATGKVATRAFTEEGQDGRVVVVSVAPTRGDDHLLASFPG